MSKHFIQLGFGREPDSRGFAASLYFSDSASRNICCSATRALVFIVGVNDALHQLMPHHVSFVEMRKRQPLHVFQHVHRLDETAAARVRQVDLRDVAGNHGLGVESQGA